MNNRNSASDLREQKTTWKHAILRLKPAEVMIQPEISEISLRFHEAIEWAMKKIHTGVCSYKQARPDGP